ncbi:MAG: hypothetical protein E6G01_06210 [Actinobacteria bacterium]|nr:MAG: hypothetical protein E6G01_06210 [Actinomycetota bacterium]
MTYPDEMVASVVTERFVACQVNTQDESSKEVVARYRQAWTPDLRVLDSEGFDLYHWNGYLPPAEFVAQLGVAQGHAYLRLHQEEQATTAFEEVLRRFPTAKLQAFSRGTGSVGRLAPAAGPLPGQHLASSPELLRGEVTVRLSRPPLSR